MTSKTRITLRSLLAVSVVALSCSDVAALCRDRSTATSERWALAVPSEATGLSAFLSSPIPDYCLPTGAIVTIHNRSFTDSYSPTTVARTQHNEVAAGCPLSLNATSCSTLVSPIFCSGATTCIIPPNGVQKVLFQFPSGATQDTVLDITLARTIGAGTDGRWPDVTATILYTTPGQPGVHCNTTQETVRMIPDSCME